MSQESLTPVAINPDTAHQHDVVRGEAIKESITDDHGFVEGALRSQNSEASADAKKYRHKREVVESIDPENVHLEGATATLAQMITARELVHSEEFEAHEPDERDEIIAGLLDQLMLDDDESKHVYYKTRLKLGEMLTQPDAKFEKTQRRYELYQARRDGVKLKRASDVDEETSEKTPLKAKLKALVEREQSEGDGTSLSETQPSAPKLRREIKKLDGKYSGIVGEIAGTGTKPEYLESQYVEFKAMTGLDNFEINDRNRVSAEREAIRKLVQRAVVAKGLEGEEKRAYEDHLVSVFHDYASLSDVDREGIHESLNARYQRSQELRALNQTSSTETTERSSLAEKIKTRLSAKLGGRAVAAAFKRHWTERGSDTKQDNSSDHETDEQLALFSDEPYKADGEKGPLKRGSEWIKDSAWMMISRNQARRVHKQQMEQARLEDMSDEERTLERQKKNDRKTSAILALGGVAALAVSFYYMKNGLDNPFNGIGSDRLRASDGDTKSGGLADLLNIPSEGGNAQEVIPGAELDTRDRGGDSLRAELFDGRGGSRNMSTQNIEGLKDFLGDYKVKENDDRGVWGISEKYLGSQGIKNPTVFETDAVKDYILRHSLLTNSSIIHPGDTIKLK